MFVWLLLRITVVLGALMGCQRGKQNVMLASYLLVTVLRADQQSEVLNYKYF